MDVLSDFMLLLSSKKIQDDRHARHNCRFFKVHNTVFMLPEEFDGAYSLSVRQSVLPSVHPVRLSVRPFRQSVPYVPNLFASNS